MGVKKEMYIVYFLFIKMLNLHWPCLSLYILVYAKKHHRTMNSLDFFLDIKGESITYIKEISIFIT